MKTVKFNPLRRVKSLDKVVVASYSTWRRVKTADYSKFKLILSTAHHSMDNSEYVYNHKGELLYFYDYNPVDIEVYKHNVFDEFNPPKSQYIIDWGESICFRIKGADVDGVPTFSHFTQESIATHYKDMNDFTPLTVGMVKHWLGVFLYYLENNYLEYKQVKTCTK